MVTWEQVCWLGSPVGRQGCGSEIEILRPLFQNLLYFLQNSRLLGTFQSWKNQTICEQTLEPVFFPERVYHTKSWELTLVFSCQCLVTTVAFQEHRKSLPICPLFSSLLLQHQIDWLRLLVGPCGHGALHEPLLQAELRLSQGTRPKRDPSYYGTTPTPRLCVICQSASCLLFFNCPDKFRANNWKRTPRDRRPVGDQSRNAGWKAVLSTQCCTHFGRV